MAAEEEGATSTAAAGTDAAAAAGNCGVSTIRLLIFGWMGSVKIWGWGVGDFRREVLLMLAHVHSFGRPRSETAQHLASKDITSSFAQPAEPSRNALRRTRSFMAFALLDPSRAVTPAGGFFFVLCSPLRSPLLFLNPARRGRRLDSRQAWPVDECVSNCVSGSKSGPSNALFVCCSRSIHVTKWLPVHLPPSI